MPIGVLESAFFGHPEIPDFTPPNIEQTIAQSLDEWSRLLPKAQGVASQVNRGNQNDILALLEQAIPGFTNQRGTLTGLVNRRLAGDVSDLSGDILRSDAARFIESGTGQPGTRDIPGFNRNLVARDIGKTAYDVKNQGAAQALDLWRTLNSIAMPRLFDPTSQLIPAPARLAMEEARARERFNLENMENQLDWLYNPGRVFLNELGGALHTALYSAAGAAGSAGIGAALGGGGSGGGGGGWQSGVSPGVTPSTPVMGGQGYITPLPATGGTTYIPSGGNYSNPYGTYPGGWDNPWGYG